MPVIIIATALLTQAVDGNATLLQHVVDIRRRHWTGAKILLGLTASLFVVGKFPLLRSTKWT